jgi:hypothetical protein
MLSALKKLGLHSIALKKTAKHGVKWHFSALPQSHESFFTREWTSDIIADHFIYRKMLLYNIL